MRHRLDLLIRLNYVDIKTMRSDRKLLILSVIFLTIQLIWLGAELGFFNISFLRKSNINFNKKIVGQIVSARNNLRTRSENELTWNDAKIEDDIHVHDSVLTLKNSSTKIKLKNGTELHLSENTLVFIEPESDESDHRIRIRFAHGSLRSRISSETIQLSNKEIIVDAGSNSEIQIKTLGNDGVEVGVIKGSARTGQANTIHQGEFLSVHNGIQKIEKISSDLKWKSEEKHLRRYVHQWPANVNLEWIGSADAIEIYKNNKIIETIAIEPGSQSLKKEFDLGTYELRLKDKKTYSDWVRFDVWQAPVIHLVSPLPRDRWGSEESVRYIWSKPEEVSMSQMQVNALDTASNQWTESSSVEWISQLSGRYEWHVVGKDNEGFLIPPAYTNPIIYSPDLLNAPKLHEIEIRKPAQTPPSSNLFFRILSLFINVAEASEPFAGKVYFDPEKHNLELSWDKVIGADKYYLEISEKPDFRVLLVETEIREQKFIWKNIKLKTEKFWWRVASSSSEKQGRFSAVAEVNTKNLEVSELAANGVRVVELVEKKKTVATEVKQIEKEVSPQDHQSKIEHTAYSWIKGNLNYNQNDLSDNFTSKIKFQGLVPSVEIGLRTPEKDYWLGMSLNFSSVRWKNNYKYDRSESDSLQSNSWSLFVERGSLLSPWGYLLGYSNEAFPVRKDLEILELSTFSMPSMGFFYLTEENKFSGLFKHHESLQILNINYEKSFKFFNFEDLRYGLKLDGSKFDSQKIKGVGLGLGLFIYFRW